MRALREHWPEYLMEAALLGAFMVSACGVGVLLWHPASPAVAALPGPALRRVLTGCAMGLTAIALIYSPWGKQSGAHMNPATTLTFLRLGRVRGADAAAYAAAQFLGGAAGVGVGLLVFGGRLADPAVDYVATLPTAGAAAAFLAEVVITGVLMSVVLRVMEIPRWANRTGVLVGLLVALYISVESPISGMSMNPARTLGSAVWAHDFRALWIYFTAPPLGMLIAAWLHGRRAAPAVRVCAKYHHDNDRRCIFCGKPAGPTG